jgi:hypothetical protein
LSRAAFFLFELLEKMRTDYSPLFGESSERVSEPNERDAERQGVSSFLDQWGWEYNIDLCAENDRVSWEHIYTRWNVIEFMNRLSYLKDKGKFLIALNGS